MASFSQRKGYKPAREVIQHECMDDSLRNGIWNCFLSHIVHRNGFMDTGSRAFPYSYSPGQIYQFADLFWAGFLKRPVDTRPDDDNKIYNEIRNLFFRFSWYEVYDFIEFVIPCFQNTKAFAEATNSVLETEMAAYRLVQGKVVEITNQSEIQAVDRALDQTDFVGAAQHLKRALELVSDKTNPDTRNSIKESISAVESAAQVLTGNPKATLGDALKIAERKQKLHSALRDAFLKLYGYTNDQGGIRHAMLEESNLSKEDALFFLITCSAFINYLKSKI